MEGGGKREWKGKRGEAREGDGTKAIKKTNPLGAVHSGKTPTEKKHPLKGY